MLTTTASRAGVGFRLLVPLSPSSAHALPDSGAGPVYKLSEKGTRMRHFYLLAALLAGFGISGCEDFNDRAADSVRDDAQMQADETRDAAQNQAENIRDQAGRDAFGNAETNPAERAADQVEASGERAADRIEAEGERRAENIEDAPRNR